MLRELSGCVLNSFRDGDVTALLSKLVYCVTTLKSKMFFPVSKEILPFSSLSLVPLCLSKERVAPASLHLPTR